MPSETVGGRYTIETEIGRGGMQVVYRAVDETLRRTVAVKVPQDAQNTRRFRESAVLSAKVNHPNVAKTLDYFEDADGRFYMVEEYVDGLNLRLVTSRFKRSDPHTAVHILHHLARGLSASHRVGVVHRDLKPSNVMIVGGLKLLGVKVTDFGIAKMAEREVDDAVAGGEETTRRSSTVMGALAYLAPEVVDLPHSPSKPADVWSIAAMAWELLTGKPPFGTGLRAIREIVSEKDPALPSSVANHDQFGLLSRQLADLILSCLRRNPDERPTAADLASRCDELCYVTPVRETGIVTNYPARSFGFIARENGGSVFFHVRSVIGPRPELGAQVWFTSFDGMPRPRAIPVVPLLPEQ
ncbi:MAG: protein kinase [Gammaproteobacteria bacterium]|nr:protein kinase [Gammaproteobacteria bacterium]